jgi:hypothetical protein
MSSPNIIPVFDPQGTLRDVPYDQLRAAVSAGGVPAHPVKDPSGQMRMIPVTRLNEAVQAGGTIVNSPVPEAQLPAYYGFTPGNIASNAWEGAKSVVQGTYALGKDLLQNPNWVEGDTSTLHKFVEQPMLDQSTKAAQSFAAGNSVEGIGHTIASGLPLIGPWAASLGEQAGTGDIGGAVAKGAGQVGTMKAGELALTRGIPAAAGAAPGAIRAGVRGINKGLEKAPGTIGGTAGAAIGGYFGGHIGAEVGGVAGAVAGRELLPQVRIPGEGFGLPNRVTGGPASAPSYAVYPGASLPENPGVFPGAPLPQAPPAEVLQARGLTQGAAAAPPDPSAALGQIGNPKPTITTPASSLPNPTPEASATIPRTLSGEGALSQVLSQLSNADLLRIAKSRGLNVSREMILKPGTANSLLISKIVNDFSPSELAEVRDTYLERTRFQHQFSSQMNPEAWSTAATQTYFPQVKIPQTVLARTRTAMTATDATGGKK